MVVMRTVGRAVAKRRFDENASCFVDKMMAHACAQGHIVCSLGGTTKWDNGTETKKKSLLLRQKKTNKNNKKKTRSGDECSGTWKWNMSIWNLVTGDW